MRFIRQRGSKLTNLMTPPFSIFLKFERNTRLNVPSSHYERMIFKNKKYGSSFINLSKPRAISRFAIIQKWRALIDDFSKTVSKHR